MKTSASDASDHVVREPRRSKSSRTPVSGAGSSKKYLLVPAAALLLALIPGSRRDAFGLGCPVTLTGATTSNSLRIMNYNAAIQVYPGDSEDFYSLSFEERAEMIAQLILADDPDVVVLNEVNQNASKDVFVQALQNRYPSYVWFVDAPNPLNDSGLMLFSKYKFGEPDRSYIGDGEAELENQGVKAWVNVSVFDGVGWDWFANKAAAMVSVLNECAGDAPFHVAFTHLQASSDEGSDGDYGTKVGERMDQLEIIRDLIEFHVYPGNRPVEPIFVVGDLNINGNRYAKPKRPMFRTTSSGTVELPYTEWRYVFDSTNPSPNVQQIDNQQHRNFFACRGQTCTYDPGASSGSFLTDAWGFETSPEDPGQTSSTALVGGSLAFPDRTKGARVDYILHNRPRDAVTGLCMQHITRGFDPLTGAGMGGDLSDHLPLTADFNLPAPRCSAQRDHPDLSQRPEEITFVVDDPDHGNYADIERPGWITFPGSVQWYYLHQPYSYEITLEGANVGYRVYQTANLSNPKPPHNGQCTEDPESSAGGPPSFGCEFTMYNPPYYVQVFGAAISGDPEARPDRTRSALPYTIRFHRHTCSSMDDACILEPAVRVGPHIWPPEQLSSGASPPEDNMMYFELESELASDGYAPKITFLLEHDLPLPPSANMPDVLSMTLVDEHNLLVCDPPSCPAKDGLGSQDPEPPGWRPGNALHSRLAIVKEATLPGDGTWTETYYLKVARDQAYQLQQGRVWVTFETDLTYFRPFDLLCVIERTWVGDDDLEARFVYDSQPVIEYLGPNWDDGRKIGQAGTTGVWWREWPWSLDRSFLRFVEPRMFEDVDDGDDYQLLWLSGEKIPPLDRSLYAPKDQPIGRTYVWSDETDPEDADYLYEMTYHRTHERPPCRPPKSSGLGDCIPPRFCENTACRLP